MHNGLASLPTAAGGHHRDDAVSSSGWPLADGMTSVAEDRRLGGRRAGRLCRGPSRVCWVALALLLFVHEATDVSLAFAPGARLSAGRDGSALL